MTQVDVDAATITNTANAAAITPGGGPAASAPSTAVVTAAPAPGLTVVKSASPADPDDFTPGRAVTYSFVVTNTGNVTVDGIAVHDSGFTGTGTLSAITCPATELAPGAQFTCTADYTLSQADVDAGKVTNEATATGTIPGGGPIGSPASSVTIPAAPHPSLALVKTASATTLARVGQPITYTFAVTNTGNVTVRGVAIREGRFTGTGPLSAVACPAGTPLAPGAKLTCTAQYRTTPADLRARRLSNTATASGSSTAGAVGSSASTAAVAVDRRTPPTTGTSAGPGAPTADTGASLLPPLVSGLGLLLAGALFLAGGTIRRRRAG